MIRHIVQEGDLLRRRIPDGNTCRATLFSELGSDIVYSWSTAPRKGHTLMRHAFRDPRFFQGGPPMYPKRPRHGRLLLYLLVFFLGAIAAIALSYAVSIQQLQEYMVLFLHGAGQVASALYAIIVVIVTHVYLLIPALLIALVLIWQWRRRNWW